MTIRHNPEMQKYLLAEYHSMAYTSTYSFCVKAHGKVAVAIVNNADIDFLERITYCERNAESHGGYYGLRMRSDAKTQDYIRANAHKLYELGTVKEFEASFQQYKANGNTGNRGDYFEKLFTELVKGTNPEKRNACFTDCGDVVVDNIHYQVKLYNATFTTENTIKRLKKAVA